MPAMTNALNHRNEAVGIDSDGRWVKLGVSRLLPSSGGTNEKRETA
jgi:hypothetical protein